MAVIIPPTPISDFPGPLPNVVDSAFRQQALQWVNHLTTVKIGEFNALQTNVNNNATVAYEQAQAAQSSAADAAASAVDAESSAASAASANGYATAAAASASAAITSESNAAASASTAGGSASAASDASTKAGLWAEEAVDVAVEPGKYSAKHWAAKAADVVAGGVISDATTGSVTTWSSSKINTLLGAKADLVGGKIPESQIPAVAITDVFTVASQAAMLALVAQRGDIAVRSDLNKSFALAAEPASTLANWVDLRTPTDAVLSVNSKTGAVTLSAADVGAEAAFTAGTSAQYLRGDKTWRDFATDVRDSVLTGLSTATRRAIAATDSVLTALGILEASKVNRQDSYATVSSGVINLGLETELYHITVSGNVTVSVSNAPTTERVVKRLIVQYSSGVVTWPASFRLPTPMPTFAAGKAYVFSIEQSPNSGVYFLVPGPEYTYP